MVTKGRIKIDMGIIIKHSIKNMISKPLRLIVLLVCITVASFAALLAFDMSGSIKNLMNAFSYHVYGNMNVYVSGAEESDIAGVEDIADMSYVGVTTGYVTTYSHDPSDYHYTTADSYRLFSFTSVEAASELRLITDGLTIDDNTAVASPSFVEKYDISVGDTVTVDTADGEEIELVISDVYQVDSQLLRAEALMISENNMRRIRCNEENVHNLWFFYVKDSSKVDDVVAFLEHNAPKANVVDMYSGDNAFAEEMTNIFYLIFLVTFLLVSFVTMSFAEKIVNERMSVIGTLRSLGVRPRNTAFILLMENALYALVGSVTGAVLYTVFKSPFIGSFVTVSYAADYEFDTSKYYGDVSLSLILVVVLSAVILECSYPLYELLKAVKTPIRDIIFNNKDTEFKYTWRRLYAGAGAVLVSIVTAFMTKSFLLLAISLASGVIGLAILLPYFIRLLSHGLVYVFKRFRLPVAQLAAENISRNRSIMSNSIMSVISILLSSLIIAITGPVWKWLSPEDLGYDVVGYVNYADEDYDYLSNVEGVNDIERVYGCSSRIQIAPSEGVVSGTEDEDPALDPLTYVCPDMPHKMTNYLPYDAYDLNGDQIVITKALAKRYGVNIGDAVTVTYHTDTDFPIEFGYTVVDIYDPYEISGTDVPDEFRVMIIAPEVYDRLFMGMFNRVLFRTDDPELLKKTLEDCSDPSVIEFKTEAESIDEMKQDGAGLYAVINGIIVGSTLLTLIGIAGNQTFSFITRKRETALLYSVAMGRKKMRRLLFLESLFSIGSASLIAALASPLFFMTLAKAMTFVTDEDLEIMALDLINFGELGIYLVIIVAIYLLTVLLPFRSLRRMNIAEELKYE